MALFSNRDEPGAASSGWLAIAETARFNVSGGGIKSCHADNGKNEEDVVSLRPRQYLWECVIYTMCETVWFDTKYESPRKLLG